MKGVTIMIEELKTKETSGRSIVVPFLVGGLMGAGIALLLAPKSGKELRKDIKDAASKTASTIKEGKNAVTEAIEAGKQAFLEERDRHIRAA